ncbi:MAG: tyrosine-type recombinase/integrase [Bdellovibrionota bacterium]|nr:tyrosine-type recombinase/integrase [Bdellovibrionota bacterium]
MSVKEIERNKKYKITVAIGYNGNKRINHYETFYGGKKEAILRENEIKSQLKNNSFVNKSKITMKELLEEWLKYSKDIWSPKTYISNVHWCEVISKSIGHIRLQDINVKILEDFYKNLRENTTYSDKTLQHFYTIITTSLKKAILWGYIKNNPNSYIEKPKVRKKEIQCYSPEEVEELLECIKNEPLKYQAIIYLALDSGARRGEIIGLTWDDINFKKQTLNINKSVQYTKELGIFEKSTKTQTSDRIIYLSNITISILKAYKKEQLEIQLKLGSKWENSKRIFTTSFGGNMHPDTPSQILEKIIKKYNLKRISFHGLRHTSISLQISSGIQTQIISKRAGHSSISTTHSIYSHFFDNEFKDVANKMNNILTMNA